MNHPDPNEMPEEVWVAYSGTGTYSASKPDAVNGIFKHETIYIRKDLAPTSQWQSMESAPRDGTEILCIIQRDVYKALSYFPDWHGVGKGAWHEFGEDYDHFPTHWQPLPSPPTKDLAAAEGEKV